MPEHTYTVRIRYSGMQFENTVTGSPQAADAKLADMYARHNITASRTNPLRGTVALTKSRVNAEIVEH